jgi:hypothetical protein
VSPALRFHDRQNGADAVQGPVEVQGEGFLPVLVRQLAKKPPKPAPALLNKKVDALRAEVGRFPDHALDVLFFVTLHRSPTSVG